MKKVFCILLVILMFPAIALADADLAAMTTDELTQLRQDIDHELSLRINEETAQVLEMDGVFVALDYAAIGAAKDYVNGKFIQKQAIVIYVRVSNSTNDDFLVRSSFDVQATLDGVLLKPLQTANEQVLFSDSKTFDPNLSLSATVRPNAARLQLGFGFFLPDDATGTFSIDFKRNWITNGYGGFFEINLADISN